MAEFELEEVRIYLGKVDRRYSAILARALNDRIAADYKVEFEATEHLARRCISDAETFLTKAREIVAEAIGSEGREDAGQSV